MSITRRKDEHLQIVLSGKAERPSAGTGLERVRFLPRALPELDLDAIDLSCRFLGKALAAPLLIGSMTGGATHAARINQALAEAAAEAGIALAVGSQRVALEAASETGLTQDLRRILGPQGLLLGNLGAAQIRGSEGVARALKAVEMLQADGLFIHLNALQEALQPGGDRDWRGVLAGIERLCLSLPCPVLVKEVGCGIDPRSARQLQEAGIAALDIAGVGGTSWALVEGERAEDPTLRTIAQSFAGWGLATADALALCRAAVPGLPLIASGGIRTGLDAARAIRLGASLVSIAAGMLPAALATPPAVTEQIRLRIAELRLTCFLTGSANLAALAEAPLQPEPSFPLPSQG